jgi:hypothetical protein
MWKWLKNNYKWLVTAGCGVAGVVGVAVPGGQGVAATAALVCPIILGAGKVAEKR